jgi:predicted transcriptional regulator
MAPGTAFTLEDACRAINAEVLGDVSALHTTFLAAGAGADLMSDVLAFINPGALLLTGLTNLQTVRTALIADARAVAYVRGKRPDEDSVALAREHALPLLCTPMTMFEACARLYQAGLPPCVLPASRGRGNDRLSART